MKDSSYERFDYALLPMRRPRLARR